MPERIRVTARPRQAVRVQTRYVIPAPEAGWSLELQQTETHLQVRQVRDEETKPWVDVIALTGLSGPAGAVPVFAIVDGALAYRFGESGSWGQLLTIESLKCDRGLSVYELWLDVGHTGTVVEFLDSLKGADAELPEVSAAAETVAHGTPVSLDLEVDEETGAWLFHAKFPAANDGVSPPALNLTVTSSEVAQGQPMTASLLGPYPDLTLALGLRAGSPGAPGNPGSPGAQGASGMPNTGLVGTGMPNGVVSASPGTIYRDTFTSGELLGTNCASQWIKVSGTGNTGWVVLRGDTGWRRLADPFRAAGTSGARVIPTATGALDVRRVGSTVYVRAYRVQLAQPV